MCTHDDCVGGSYGTCEDEKIGRDAEDAARESGDEAAGEEGRGHGYSAWMW